MRKFDKVKESEFIKALNKEMGLSVEVAKEKYEGLKLPRRATRKSSGYDFFAPFHICLEPGQEIVVPTGVKAYMEKDEELCVFVRSNAGFKFNIRLKNQVGKIDSDYVDNPNNEGHIFIALKNEGDKVWIVGKGGAFAQGSFYKYLVTDDDCPVNEERVGGIGSTNN